MLATFGNRAVSPVGKVAGVFYLRALHRTEEHALRAIGLLLYSLRLLSPSLTTTIVRMVVFEPSITGWIASKQRISQESVLQSGLGVRLSFSPHKLICV